MPLKTDLSGADWWRRNHARFPNSTPTADLASDFRDRAEIFIAALRAAGAQVLVTSTRRDPGRAYVMHDAWRLAHGEIQPSDVPLRPGVEIDWDHGDDKASRTAAIEIVTRTRMAHGANLTSNHTRGLAIDMSVNWKDTLYLRVPKASGVWSIDGAPRSGARNRELHELAGSAFGVYKLRSDPPHWSSNGR